MHCRRTLRLNSNNYIGLFSEMLLGVKEVNQYTYDVDDGSEYPHLRAAVEYGGYVARYDHDYGDPAQSVSAGSLIVTLNIWDLLPGLDQGVAHYNDGKRRGYGAEVDQKLKAAAMTADTMMPTEGAPFLLVFANALGRAPSSAMACIVSAFRF